jgi:hypothetical protein
MEDSFQDSQSLSTFADRIFGGNPFPKDDSRHEMWETNACYAAEEIARVQSAALGRLPADAAASEQFLEWILVATGEYFDIYAKRFLIFTVKGPKSVILYEELLTRIIDFQTERVLGKSLCGLPKEQVLSELRIRLNQRKAHWIAEAFKLSLEVEPTAASQYPANETVQTDQKSATPEQMQGSTTPEKAVVIDRNLIARKIQGSPDGCVTNREAATYFGVKPKTIRAWLNGEVQGKRLTSGAKRGTVSNDSILRLERKLKSS